MRSFVLWSTVVALPLALAACGSEGASTFDDPNKPKDGTVTTPPSGGFDTTAAPPEDMCVPYVVSKENDLYRFSPTKLTFTKIGRLDCPVSGNPTSMGIDRSNTAWVNYADGSLFKVSTTDAKCTPTAFAKNQKGFLKFGMAFATNGAGSEEETLYISGLVEPEGKGFGKIDMPALTVTILGDYSNTLAKQAAELTGTGDGRVYGFFTTQPATLAEINRETGGTTNERPLPGVNFGNAFAQAFWGGDFWFFTAEGTTPSKVTQLKSSGSGEVAVVVPDVGGFRIVGAGVATCAPLTPPK